MPHKPTEPAIVARIGRDFIANRVGGFTPCIPQAVNTASVRSAQLVSLASQQCRPLKLSAGCEEEEKASEYRYSRSRKETSRAKNFLEKSEEC